MYSVNQFVAIIAIFSKLALSLPLSPEVDLQPAVINNNNPPSYSTLSTRDELTEYVDPLEDSSLKTRSVIEEHTNSMEHDSVLAARAELAEEEFTESLDSIDPEKKTLATREPHDPHPEFAPTQETRKKEIANRKKGLDPKGRNGDQVAKDFGSVNKNNDNGAFEYIEQGHKKLTGQELKEPCGKGCQDSNYHKFSEASQNSKASRARKAAQGH